MVRSIYKKAFAVLKKKPVTLWGISLLCALLAAFMVRKNDGESLADYLDNRVFAGAASTTRMAEQADIDGFNAFLSRYKKAFPMEKAAVEGL